MACRRDRTLLLLTSAQSRERHSPDNVENCLVLLMGSHPKKYQESELLSRRSPHPTTEASHATIVMPTVASHTKPFPGYESDVERDEVGVRSAAAADALRDLSASLPPLDDNPASSFEAQNAWMDEYRQAVISRCAAA